MSEKSTSLVQAGVATPATKSQKPQTVSAGDKKVIIRSIASGVHYGTLVARDGDTVTLRDSRRVYRWQIDYAQHGTSQVTCSELAVFGPHGDSRIAVPVAEIEVRQVIEVIPVTEAAARSIEGWPT